MKVKANTNIIKSAQACLGISSIWDEAKAYLCARDETLATLFVDECRPPKVEGSLLRGLVRAIIAQQISNKVACQIWQRVNQAASQSRPFEEALMAVSVDTWRLMGLSATKAETIVRVIEHYRSGEWTEAKWLSMSDEAIREMLTQVKGIGPWSANSALIFGLGRTDVCPLDDFGIRTALCRHYFSLQTPKTLMRKPHDSAVKLLAGIWAPYRTVAALVLWHSLGNAPQ